MSALEEKELKNQIETSLEQWFKGPEKAEITHFLYNTRALNFLHRLAKKDLYTLKHSFRVAEYAQWIGNEIQLKREELIDLYKAALLHDIGKIFTPNEILKKPTRLTAQEFAIIKQHPIDSEILCSQIPEIKHLLSAIRAHHERYDGSGYPDRIKEDDIPQYARIIFVADTFDAMTSGRIYREKVNLEDSYEEILSCSGTQFDPDYGPLFVAVHKEYLSEDFEKRRAA